MRWHSADRFAMEEKPSIGFTTALVNCLHEVERNLINVTPAPGLTWLGGFHNGMACCVEVFGRVFVLGGVATADMATSQAEPKMHPSVPHCHAFFTAFRVGCDGPNLIKMWASLCRHASSPYLMGCFANRRVG
jgi:hypothetical protein